MQRSVAIVVPCFNEAEVLPHFHRELTAILDRLPGYRFDMLFVDDGSRDGTLEQLLMLAARDSRVRVASLSRNFGHQAALSAGLDLVDADAAISMDCDLQHPPALIPQLLSEWEAGHDIVSTIREETADSGWLKRATSAAFYKLINRLSDTTVIAGAADFGLLSRAAYTALRDMPERHRFLRGMVSWLGFSRTFIHFQAPARFAGQSKYTLRKMLRLAKDALLSFSSLPLRVASVSGMVVTLGGAGYLLYVLGRMLFVGDLVPGWASLIATMLFLGGVQLLCLGVASEYIARIYEQVKGRPQYLLKVKPQPVAAPRRAGRTGGFTEQQLLEFVESMRAQTREHEARESLEISR